MAVGLLLWMFSIMIASPSQDVSVHVLSSTKQTTMDTTLIQKYWREIEVLERDRMTLGISNKLDELIPLLDPIANPFDLVKAIQLKARTISTLEEDGDYNSMEYVEEKIKTSTGMVRSILYSYAGGMYFNFLQNNSYRLSSRTDVVRTDPGDVRQWTPTDFLTRSADYYLNSLQCGQCEGVSIKDASKIIVEGDNLEVISRNLYEVLLNTALDHFTTAPLIFQQSVDAYVMDDPALFKDFNEFIKINLPTAQPHQYQLNALHLFQVALNTYSNHNVGQSYYEAMRLNFLREHSRIAGKNDLYKSSVQDYLTLYQDDPIQMIWATTMAEIYLDEANRYNPAIEETIPYKNRLIEAANLLETVLERYPGAYRAGTARSLLANIKGKSASLTLPDTYVSATNFTGSIRFKNLGQAELKLFKLSIEDFQRLRYANLTTRRNYFETAIPIRSQKVTFPDIDDYLDHTADLIIEGLEKGIYASVLISSEINEDVDFRNVQYINITDIGLITRGESNQSLSVWVVSTKDGGPVKGAEVVATPQQNFGNSTKNQRKLLSDANGKVTFLSSQNDVISANYDGSTVLDNYVYHGRDFEPRDQNVWIFFTDRSIYRPGQIVYFKGTNYNYREDGKEPTLNKNKRVKVSLMDVNNKEVESMTLTTSAMGSINGQFVLPESTLNGYFYLNIEGQGGQTSFRVESYKRPKFEVQLEKPEHLISLNDSIEIAGLAKMYAGTPVRYAQVSYTVQRESYFPMIPWRYRMMPFVNEVVDIATGTTTTDEMGKFEVAFKAIPGAELPSMRPFYKYKITTHVTDPSGETRSSQIVLKLSHTPYLIQAGIPNVILADQFSGFDMDITNSEGITQSVGANVIITSLKAPGVLLHNRLGGVPDVFLYSEKDFKSKVPHAPYKQEDELENWEEIEKLFSASFDPSSKKKIDFPVDKWKSGVYKLTLKVPVSGADSITEVRYFKVINTELKGNNGFNSLIEKVASAQSVEVGQGLKYILASDQKEVCVFISIEKGGKIVREGWKKVKGTYAFDVQAELSDRGGFFIHSFSNGHNKVSVDLQPIQVPWTDKRLDIQWLSERKEFLPGASESWSFRVNDLKNNSISNGEVVAALYDASLDAIHPHSWPSISYSSRYTRRAFRPDRRSGGLMLSLDSNSENEYSRDQPRVLPSLNTFGLYYRNRIMYRGGKDLQVMEMAVAESAPPSVEDGIDIGSRSLWEEGVMNDAREDILDQSAVTSTRENLNETVFFFPNIAMDKEGKFDLNFKMNEALTRWRLMLFVHDPALASGFAEYFIETRKDVMVFPNVPRFLRQGDRIRLSMSVENQSSETLDISANLTLSDGITQSDLSDWLKEPAMKRVEVSSGNSAVVFWEVEVPSEFTGLLKLRYEASGNQHVDAEEHIIPVLTNRQLVTESIALWVNPGKERKFVIPNYQNKMQAHGLQHHSFTLEMSENPAWYAVMALPFLNERSFPTADAIMNRYYANSLASNIISKNPVIKTIFSQWKSSGELISELDKNQELKQIVLNETPWLRQAESEAIQRNRIALLFEWNQIEFELSTALQQLIELQLLNGGFSWYKGSRAGWYTTQQIVEQFGHLDFLGVKDVRKDRLTRDMLLKAISYLDGELVRHYNDQMERRPFSGNNNDNYLSPVVIHYLYTRSFYMDVPQNEQLRKIADFYRDQIEQHWLNLAVYEKGLAALAMHRSMRAAFAKKVVKHLADNMIRSEELGYYWNYSNSYHWYQAPLETHALMIEVFHEIESNKNTLDHLNLWLLKNKQTNAWKTQKATTKAIYALLRTTGDWIQNENPITVSISNQIINVPVDQKQAGTGYYKLQLEKNSVNPADPTILLANMGTVAAWGGFYWQYFQDMDKVAGTSSLPLQIRRTVNKVVHDNQGKRLVPVGDSDNVKVGDRLTVRLEISVDRPMEFIHLKDGRASGCEPVDALSGFEWQPGIGFYRDVKDTGVNFFFDYLPAGSYVFEYDLSVFHAGDFSLAPASIQSYYAPEFSSFTTGRRLISQ